MIARRAQAGPDVDTAAMVAAAHALRVLGWVRPTGEIHAEGAPDAVAALLGDIPSEPARVEGHEQFAIRGVSAGAFVVLEGYELRLEVAGAPRCWTVPKAPSLDPAVKRFAIELERPGPDAPVWDEGTYEQGGRVAWPEALERGHAVFVLHGDTLRGGFALQRTRPGQWLLIKRRDEHARPG